MKKKRAAALSIWGKIEQKVKVEKLEKGSQRNTRSRGKSRRRS